MPRKKHEPTNEQRAAVMVLAGGGVAQELIGKAIGVSVPTLEKHYRSELDTGKTQITKHAIATLLKAMQEGGKGAVGAAAFWLKCREGWQERQTIEHELSTPEGGSVKVIVEYEEAPKQEK